MVERFLPRSAWLTRGMLTRGMLTRFVTSRNLPRAHCQSFSHDD
jgi:hypothetical protein